MRTEFGGYLEFETYHGKEYHEGALALNSGRHCLEYLLRARKIRKLWLPRFLCDSVEEICAKAGVEVARYGIGRDFLPRFQEKCTGSTWLYAVNYYGQLSREKLQALQEVCGNVIVDNAQAFFCPPLPGVDTLYTCRKFFGVADGGYLYTAAKLPGVLEQDRSHGRMDFVLGRFEEPAGKFYAQSAANNRRFGEDSLKTMSPLTRNLLRGIDYDRVLRVRRENFAYLHEKLGDINGLELSVPEGPFMYPLYVSGGGALRRQLQMKKIFVPTLWPNVLAQCAPGSPEYDLAENILPLPVDQRYDLQDMEAMLEAVNSLLSGKAEF